MWLSLAFVCVSGKVKVYEFARKMVLELIKEDFLKRSLKPSSQLHTSTLGFLRSSHHQLHRAESCKVDHLEPEHLCSGAGWGGEIALCCFPYDSCISAKATWSPASNLKSEGSYGTWKEQGQHAMITPTLTVLPGHPQQRAQVMEHWKEQGQHTVTTPHPDHAAGPGPSAAVCSARSPAVLAGAPGPFPPCNPLARSLQTKQRVSFEGLTIGYFLILSASQHWRLQLPWAPHSKQYSTPFF